MIKSAVEAKHDEFSIGNNETAKKKLKHIFHMHEVQWHQNINNASFCVRSILYTCDDVFLYCNNNNMMMMKETKKN